MHDQRPCDLCAFLCGWCCWRRSCSAWWSQGYFGSHQWPPSSLCKWGSLFRGFPVLHPGLPLSLWCCLLLWSSFLHCPFTPCGTACCLFVSFCGAAWPLLAPCDAACCLCFPGSGSVWTAAAVYVRAGGVGGASVALLVVGVFEARGRIFNFQYAMADSAISPLTMTGGAGTYPSTISTCPARNKRGSRSCLPWSPGSSLPQYSWPP